MKLHIFASVIITLVLAAYIFGYDAQVLRGASELKENFRSMLFEFGSQESMKEETKESDSERGVILNTYKKEENLE